MKLEWINIDDQLPESGEPVLATNMYDKWVEICILKRTRWFNSWDINKESAVPVIPTHWMPLPEPPQTDTI